MADEPTIPTEPEAVVLDRAPQPRPRRRAPLFIALAVIVVGGLGAAVLLVRGGKPDADETLEDLQSAVGEASSFTFTMSGESQTSFGDATAGSDTTTRYSGDGEWTAGRWHVRADSGFGAIEVILDGETSYDRWADEDGALEDETWSSYEDARQTREELLEEIQSMNSDSDDPEVSGMFEGEDFVDIMAVSVASSLYLGANDGMLSSESLGSGSALTGPGLTADPTGFLDAIGRMADPSVASSDGTTTLETTLQAPADFVEAFGRPLPDGHLQVDVGPDDLPTSLRFEIASGDNSQQFEITFTSWNEPVEIVVPSGDDVEAFDEDFGDMVDEEGVRAISEVALVWPTSLPEGWELSIYSPSEVADGEFIVTDCEAVELDWDAPYLEGEDESEEEPDYVWLMLRSATCATAEDPTPFQPGGPAGLPSREGSFSDFGPIEVLFGDTAIQIDTTLDAAELEPILASLAAVDVETLLAAAL